MTYNIVTSYNILNEIKKCKYFKINLGFSSTNSINDNKNRSVNFSNKDMFAYFYNMRYNTTIYAQGNIGDIKFYKDVYITQPLIAVYLGEKDDFSEYIYDFDYNYLTNNGIEKYIGHILKISEDKQKNKNEQNKLHVNRVDYNIGNADNVIKNPGAVTYADVKAYLESQNKKRFSD